MTLQEIGNLLLNGLFFTIVLICGYYFGKNEAYKVLWDICNKLADIMSKETQQKPHCIMCLRNFVSKEETQNRPLNTLSECYRCEGVSDICEDCASACKQYRIECFKRARRNKYGF